MGQRGGPQVLNNKLSLVEINLVNRTAMERRYHINALTRFCNCFLDIGKSLKCKLVTTDLLCSISDYGDDGDLVTHNCVCFPWREDEVDAGRLVAGAVCSGSGGEVERQSQEPGIRM